MMLWLAMTALAVCAAALVALPFLRPRAAVAPPAPEEIYKTRIDSIAREEQAGEIDPAAAEELRTEVGRRLLEEPSSEPAAAPSDPRFDRVSAIAVAAIVVVGSAVLYAATGTPNAPSVVRGGGGDLAGSGAALPDVDTMIERLQARLADNPNDPEGWRMLGWSLFETERYAEAQGAYRRALELDPGNAGFKSALAEAITQASLGAVSPEALRLFQQALAADAADERARYYLALAKAQGGDARGAISDWIEGVRAAAPDSPWAARMRADAEAAAREAGIDISARMPPAPVADTSGRAPPISAEVVAGANDASPEARQQMILDMVASLEARLTRAPRDADGWIRLMRSRMVLNQPDLAQAALERGLRAFNGDQTTQNRLRAAASDLNVPGA